eukprot:CAMPEP_0181168016 /NCGR_PEP_ID=MMETSP1096-20121128/33_1 /TAXON_ID=156174 ORGANISM="Chrysochromulina ericina, Strain CCMP281" /NCGR_SAMPLE_ID=MMETSP1096 /ASSEMBLY_ACC=CAM_ASM_000453 /LENGTH=77 /DNA_ID=CAMNT_0023255333 /DNA_START=767 /DNA_END=1001 /DNA_ORIENTATION=-
MSPALLGGAGAGRELRYGAVFAVAPTNSAAPCTDFHALPGSVGYHFAARLVQRPRLIVHSSGAGCGVHGARSTSAQM